MWWPDARDRRRADRRSPAPPVGHGAPLEATTRSASRRRAAGTDRRGGGIRAGDRTTDSPASARRRGGPRLSRPSLPSRAQLLVKDRHQIASILTGAASIVV